MNQDDIIGLSLLVAVLAGFGSALTCDPNKRWREQYVFTIVAGVVAALFLGPVLVNLWIRLVLG